MGLGCSLWPRSCTLGNLFYVDTDFCIKGTYKVMCNTLSSNEALESTLVLSRKDWLTHSDPVEYCAARTNERRWSLRRQENLQAVLETKGQKRVYGGLPFCV